MSYSRFLNSKSIAAIASLAVVGVVTFLYLWPTHPASDRASRAAGGSVDSKPKPGSQVALSLPNEQPATIANNPQTSIYSEIRDSKNLRATVEKLRSMPDPTGAISYQLARAIDDCTDYRGDKILQFQARAATNKDVVRRDQQNRLIADMTARCVGFESDSESFAMIGELQDKALQAKNPAAVARSLRFDRSNTDVASKDAVAIGLLENSPFPDVIKEFAGYVAQRNKGPGLAPDEIAKPGEFQKYKIADYAWILLQCDLGQDCGSQSRLLVKMCAQYAECGAEDMNQFAREKWLSPTEYAASMAIKQRLLDAFQAKDWSRFGLYPLPEKSGK